MRMPFYIRGNADNHWGMGDRHIVIISEVSFEIGGREWGSQEHYKQDHPESYDKDIGITPMRGTPDEYGYPGNTEGWEKHVLNSEEEVFQFMKDWWAKQ